jgi:hypothetical protein
MELELRQEFAGEPDLRHQVRRLRWFKKSFRRDAWLIAQHHAVELTIEDRRLTEVFLNWIEAFNRQKIHASLDRRDFTLFAAGLLLREFIKTRPVSARSRQTTPAEASIVSFWAEGFLYTNYCLNVLSAVVQQEFGESLSLSAGADDLRLLARAGIPGEPGGDAARDAKALELKARHLPQLSSVELEAG